MVMLKESCWCGSGLKYQECHRYVDDRIAEYRKKGYEVPDKNIIKNSRQMEGIRESGKINTAILDYVSEKICCGMSTEEINTLVYDKTIELGGIPATLGYEGFPKSICTSINDQVCHGIPSEKVHLKEGDIINVDISTVYHGYYSDSSRMFCMGKVSDERKRLVDVTKECVELGLRQVRPWGFLGDIGQAINDHAKSKGYSVVEEIGGHGVGLEFHEEPWVSHVSKGGTGMLLVPGMIFTIEPMINMGSRHVVFNKKDGWTVTTKDGKPSAQWEYMVLVTETGYEVLAY
ncbi:methionyl aminopeptidase [Anaerotaenia torta]|uniref:methionyl aminopeptidase n=1 Tax=Anaerotaenia torta TaxID=433293 RepID=UPI003D1A50B1